MFDQPVFSLLALTLVLIGVNVASIVLSIRRKQWAFLGLGLGSLTSFVLAVTLLWQAA